MPRTATAHLFHSVNGVVEEPHLWQFDPFGAEEGHVISSTLPAELPRNSTLVTGDPVDYVRSLREREGGPISVLGGIETI